MIEADDRFQRKFLFLATVTLDFSPVISVVLTVVFAQCGNDLFLLSWPV